MYVQWTPVGTVLAQARRRFGIAGRNSSLLNFCEAHYLGVGTW